MLAGADDSDGVASEAEEKTAAERQWSEKGELGGSSEILARMAALEKELAVSMPLIPRVQLQCP
eukprot:2922780-Rhodomonas_salina.1